MLDQCCILHKGLRIMEKLVRLTLYKNSSPFIVSGGLQWEWTWLLLSKQFLVGEARKTWFDCEYKLAKNDSSSSWRKYHVRVSNSHQNHRKLHLYFDGWNEISLNSWFLSQSFHKLSEFVWDFFLVGCLSLWLSLFLLALISVDQILVLSNCRGIPGQGQHSLIWCLEAVVLLSPSCLHFSVWLFYFLFSL